MTFEDLDFDDEMDFEDDFVEEGEDGALPEESGNRTFLILAGVIGGAIILTIICIVIFVMFVLPQQRADQAAQDKAVMEQETEVAMIIEQTSTSAAMTSIAAAFTHTPTQTQMPTDTPVSTSTEAPPTPVVAVGTSEKDAINATATALQATANHNALMLEATLTAQFTATPTLVDPSALPEGGFADRVGLPVMVGFAALLIVVIILARRMRTN